MTLLVTVPALLRRRGVFAENDPDEQQKRFRYNDLVASEVILHNGVDMRRIEPHIVPVERTQTSRSSQCERLARSQSVLHSLGVGGTAGFISLPWLSFPRRAAVVFPSLVLFGYWWM